MKLAEFWSLYSSDRLGRRIVSYMVLASALLSILAAGFQLYTSYQRDLFTTKNEFEIVEESFLPGLSNALWEFNFPFVDSLLEGILAQANVVHLRLVAESGQSWERGSLTTDKAILTKVFPISHVGQGPSKLIVGELQVTVSLKNIQDRLWAQFFSLMVSNFGKTLIASLVMLAIFDSMVSRHLRSLATMAANYSWVSEAKPFQLTRPQKAPDELDKIVNALNKARQQIFKGHNQLILRTDELVEANQLLSEANKEQAEFTYAISHDLKSPTNTLGMLISEMQESLAEGEDCKDILIDMQTTNRRMGQLVEDVLSYSRIVDENVEFESIDMNALISEILQDLAADISLAQAEIRSSDLPTIWGHRVQVRILFQNLVSNAIKFRSPDRPPQISISCCHMPGRNTAFSVTDNGIGIAEKHREQVFGLFKRLHVRSTYDGTGLGLTICRRVMSNHQGVISVHEAPGGGSRFEVEFWVGQDEQENSNCDANRR